MKKIGFLVGLALLVASPALAQDAAPQAPSANLQANSNGVGENYFNGGCDGCVGCASCAPLGRFSAGGGLMGRSACGGYIALQGGWVGLKRFAGVTSPAATMTTQHIETFNDGWSLGAAAGRSVGSSGRAEVEFSWRNNTARNFTQNSFTNGALTGTQNSTVFGKANSFSTLLNLYYDIPVGTSPFTFYLGGGVGVTYLDADWIAPGIASQSADKWALAGQAIGGMTTKLTQTVDFFIDYRYFATDGVPVRDNNPPFATLDDFNNQSNNVMIGFRIWR